MAYEEGTSVNADLKVAENLFKITYDGKDDLGCFKYAYLKEMTSDNNELFKYYVTIILYYTVR